MLTDHMGAGKGNGEPSGGPNGREAAAEDAGVELSLGLSLNGRFGVDPSKNGSQITRSSSISVFPPLSLDLNNQFPAPSMDAPARSHSLPTETQAENWRKRKELQSMRRSEARKRRMEKQKTPTPRSPTPTPTPTPTRTPAPTPTPTPRPDDGVNGNGAPPGTLKTMGSQASGSSVLSQLENFPNKVTAAVLGNADQAAGSSQPAQGNNEPPQPQCRIPRPRADAAAAEKKAAEGRQELQNLMMAMPSVTTIGNGPNGRKVDGLLYKYSRGEEVKILCVCHGSFMSPADFWRHAGGEDVENPLKHIVVSPSLIL